MKLKIKWEIVKENQFSEEIWGPVRFQLLEAMGFVTNGGGEGNGGDEGQQTCPEKSL